MRFFRTAAAVTTLAFLATPAAAQLPKGFDSYVTTAMREFQVPGLAIAVVKDGKVVLERGYGVRTLGQPAPVDAHTLFAIASNSKAFTATLLGQLVDSGRVQWDGPVVSYLPDFQLWDPWVTRQIQVRDLLSHRSGLGLGGGDLLWMYSTNTADDVIRQIRWLRPNTSFRTTFNYQNIMFLAAGQVVERLTGKPWGQDIKQRIFDPLGMTESNTSVTQLRPGMDYASPHSMVNGKLTVVPYDTVDNLAPAGGINSSVHDMARWVMAQLDSGRVGDRHLWSASVTKALWAPVTNITIGDYPPALAELRPNFYAYGLGFFLRDYRGHKMVWHTGGLSGMTSQVTLIPDQRLGVVILTNQETPIYAALTMRILDAYLGGIRTDWVAAYKAQGDQGNARVDAEMRRADSLRARDVGPSLPLARYVGKYADPMLGTATISMEGGHLVMRLPDHPLFVGDLSHWQYDTFKCTWRDAKLASSASAFVTFALDADGTIRDVRMAPFDPRTDFSYDYQDLDFTPVR